MTSALGYQVAPAVDATAPPPIPLAQQWGRTYSSRLSSSTPDPSLPGPLLDLSQGVPGTAPHPSVLAALSKAAQDPAAARYGAILGEAELRAGVAEEVRVRYQLPEVTEEEKGSVEASDVGITTGCNMAFLTLLMTLCPPGSSVILPVPAYFNHSMSLSLQSLHPIYIPSSPSSNFLPSLTSARSALLASRSTPSGPGSNIRAIVLVTPNNPTGAVYPPETLKEWFDLAKEFGVCLVLDETYKEFVDEEKGAPHGLFKDPEWRRTLVSLGSFSKGYRIPGHRLGSIIASPELLRRIATVCDCMQICPPRPPQLALAPLLPSLRSDLLQSSTSLSSRRALFADSIHSVPGWRVISSGGYFAYVAFPASYALASAALGVKRKRLGSEEIAKVLAERVGVVVLPGSFFVPKENEKGMGEGQAEGEEMKELKEDRWLRFAVANVSDQVVKQLPPRLRIMNSIMGVGDDE